MHIKMPGNIGIYDKNSMKNYKMAYIFLYCEIQSF
jgi:hypothetical protein